MHIPCSHCNEKFDNTSGFRVHLDVQHPGHDFTCAFDDCSRQFDTWHSLKNHLLRYHQAPLKPTASDNINVAGNSLSINVPGNDCILENVDELASSSECITETLRNFIREEVTEDLESLVKDEADLLVAKLCSRVTVPRSVTSGIIQDFSSFFSSGIIDKLKKLVLNLLEDSSVSEEEKAKIRGVFNVLSNPFKHVGTDFLRKRHFQESGCYVAPQSYVIHTRMERVKTPDGVKLRMRDVTGQFVPLREVLKKFLELPDVFDVVFAYIHTLEEDKTLSNFMQSSSFKRKLAMYPAGTLVLPLNCYEDDFEPNAALGNHSEKLGAGYIGLPFLPPHCRSKLTNILLALLFNADDRKLYGNKKVYKPLIDELNFLSSSGVNVLRPNGSVVRVYFVVGLLAGDNLGLNANAGFVESFCARFFCRECKVPKPLSESLTKEIDELLRTSECYHRDVLVDDYTQTGIKEMCVFEAVSGFETPTDVGFDPFHDLQEGVCHYTLKPILKHFHAKDKYFLENLNDRMYLFNFLEDSDNEPPSILPEALDGHNKLKMTGAEMFTFVRLLGVIIGDLVEEGDRFWDLYLLLHDIVLICNSQILPKSIGPTLEFLVQEHHALYKDLTKETLKPKHHFLTHYNTRTIELKGPPGLMSTVRYEAKHKPLKAVANVCCTRVNLPMTVAIKVQEELCYRFVSQRSLKPVFLVGPGQVVDLTVEFVQYPAFTETLPQSLRSNVKHQLCANWVDYNDVRYKRNMAVFTGFDSGECPQFAKIELILVCNDEPLFVCSPLDTLSVDSHTRGTFVMEVLDELNWFCLSPTVLSDPLPLSIYETPGTNEKVVVPKHVLTV